MASSTKLFWTCRVCTFAENRAGHLTCDVCNTETRDRSRALIDGSKVFCPICTLPFSLEVIEAHAAECVELDTGEMDPAPPPVARQAKSSLDTRQGKARVDDKQSKEYEEEDEEEENEFSLSPSPEHEDEAPRERAREEKEEEEEEGEEQQPGTLPYGSGQEEGCTQPYGEEVGAQSSGELQEIQTIAASWRSRTPSPLPASEADLPAARVVASSVAAGGRAAGSSFSPSPLSHAVEGVSARHRAAIVGSEEEEEEEDDSFLSSLMTSQTVRPPTQVQGATRSFPSKAPSSSSLSVEDTDVHVVASQSPQRIDCERVGARTSHRSEGDVSITASVPPTKRPRCVMVDEAAVEDSSEHAAVEVDVELEVLHQQERRRKLDEIVASDALLAETIARNEELELKLAEARSKPPPATKSFPRNWAPMGDNRVMEVVIYPPPHVDCRACEVCETLLDASTTLCPNCDTVIEHERVIRTFLESFPGSTRGDVERITRVQHVRLWGKYVAFKQDMLEDAGDALDVNEKFLFHGAPTKVVRAIVQEGFDIRVANLSGALGIGTYFAANASYSHTYSSKNGAHGSLEMLLCRVLLGKCAPGKSGLRKPPPGYHSVINARGEGCGDANSLYAVFDNHQSYPEYLIKYTRGGALVPGGYLPSVMPRPALPSFAPPPFAGMGAYAAQMALYTGIPMSSSPSAALQHPSPSHYTSPQAYHYSSHAKKKSNAKRNRGSDDD